MTFLASWAIQHHTTYDRAKNISCPNICDQLFVRWYGYQENWEYFANIKLLYICTCRDDDNDRSDDDDEDGRMDFSINKQAIERQRMKDEFLAAEHGNI